MTIEINIIYNNKNNGKSAAMNAEKRLKMDCFSTFLKSLFSISPCSGRELAYKPTIGSYSLHMESNNNGHRVISFASNYRVTVDTTLFSGKKIHKETWR